MIKAIIFDYDETLVKTLDSRIQAYIKLAILKYNFILSEEKIRKAFGLPYEVFIKSLFGEVDSVENIIKNYQELVPQFPNVAYGGALEIINKLLLLKYPVGIVSGSRKNMMINDMTRLNFPIDRFFYIQSGEDTQVHKPDPKVFEPLFSKLKEINVIPEEVLHIGDDLRDHEAATKAGMQSVVICNHTTTKEQLENVEANYINSFEELESILQN